MTSNQGQKRSLWIESPVFFIFYTENIWILQDTSKPPRDCLTLFHLCQRRIQRYFCWTSAAVRSPTPWDSDIWTPKTSKTKKPEQVWLEDVCRDSEGIYYTRHQTSSSHTWVSVFGSPFQAEGTWDVDRDSLKCFQYIQIPPEVNLVFDRYGPRDPKQLTIHQRMKGWTLAHRSTKTQLVMKRFHDENHSQEKVNQDSGWVFWGSSPTEPHFWWPIVV